MIHGSPGKFVFLSSTAAEEEKRLFGELARLFSRRVDYFDIVSAAAGEQNLEEATEGTDGP